jgi:hypothetical protein
MLSTAHPKASPLAFRDLTPFPSHHRPPSAQRSTPRRQRARHDTREAATSRLYIYTHPTVASTLRPSVALIETASVPQRILTHTTSSTASTSTWLASCSCRVKGTRLETRKCTALMTFKHRNLRRSVILQRVLKLHGQTRDCALLQRVNAAGKCCSAYGALARAPGRAARKVLLLGSPYHIQLVGYQLVG